MATAPGRAAVAVCRISGPRTRETVARLAGRVPAPRHAQLCRLVIPRAAKRWTRDSSCFSRAAELHLRGLRGAAGAWWDGHLTCPHRGARLHGLRPAEPGEFSRRAFLTASSISPKPRVSRTWSKPKPSFSAARPSASSKGDCRVRRRVATRLIERQRPARGGAGFFRRR